MPAQSAESMYLAQAIVNTRLTAPTVARLAEWLGTDELEVERLIVAAFDAGEVEPWPDKDDRVTLTPLSAERLGVRLNVEGERWIYRKTEDRKERQTAKERRVIPATVACVGMEGLVCSRPTPLEELVRAEDRASRRVEGGLFRPADAVPLPTVLLGERLIWPVRLLASGGCPACMGRPKHNEYCLVCDRYGREWMLPAVSKSRRRQLPERVRARKPRRESRAERFGLV